MTIPGKLQLKSLAPRGDYHMPSPYNIHTLSRKQVMRIFQLIS